MNNNNSLQLGDGYQRLRWPEKLAYGLGDFASNLSFTYTSLFLMAFYADAYGLSLAQASSILIIARCLDALFNLAMGCLIDRTRSRYGKLRPYLLWGSLPLGVMTVLNFYVFECSFKFEIALLTYTLYCLIYTFVNTPYAAMTNRLTQHEQSRASLSVYRFVFAFAGYFVVATWSDSLLRLMPGGNNSFAYVVAIFALLATLCFWGCFAGTRERVSITHEPARKISRTWSC